MTNIKYNINNNNNKLIYNNKFFESLNEINKLIPENFNYRDYILINNDLNITDELQAKKHYLKYGKNEKRFISLSEINKLVPKDFNYNNYISMNKDLNINDELQAKHHYLKYGKNEKRYYFDTKYLTNNEDCDNFIINYDDFDWKAYLFLNNELIDCNNHESCYHHYKYYGFKEKRKYYKINYDNFDWELYLYYNNDLLEIGINNRDKAWEYWDFIGFKQSRSYRNRNIFFNNRFILNDYFSLIDEFIKIYKITREEIINNPKNEFRYFCFKYLNYIRSIEINYVKIDSIFEAVLIEFRCFPHLEFIIRNNILKLGNKWSFTIVCGNLNYEFIKQMSFNISPNIKIIKTKHDNLFPSEYNTLLSSKYFWNLFHGKKILIYQEDSIIFKSNIDDFLEWDYIGAPWPQNQNDNSHGVGNGGLSLRTKKCMIDVINKIDIEKTELNSSTINYMKTIGLKKTPEDVYFTLNMIKYNIGKVADRITASNFSTELIFNDNSMGGHNFWLATNLWKSYLYKHVLYSNISLFNICAISTPYGLRIGGGEIFILNIAKYFINYKNCIIYLFTNEEDDVCKKTITEVLNSNYVNYFIFFDYKQINKYYGTVTFHLDMCNSKYPIINGCASNPNNNFFHCQFPFDINRNSSSENLYSYKNIILNSEFTKKIYIKYTSKYSKNKQINVIHPNCYNEFLFKHNIKKDKQKNSFVMIGRIFDFNPNSNNKNFDIALKYFEKLSLNKVTNFSLHVIGEVYSTKMLDKLKNFKIDNIYFHNNINNNEKYNILSQCEYVINMVGLNRDIDKECYAYEHFGISMIEAIYFKCIPISVNGGFPSYYIKKNNGYLFNSEKEFYDILKEIIVQDKIITYDEKYFKDVLENFNQKSFNEKMNKMLN
jgi:hypothetical protein